MIISRYCESIWLCVENEIWLMHIVADIDSSNLHKIGGTSGSGISLRITRKKSKWKRRCSWSTNLNHRQVISLRWLSGRTKSHTSNDELNMKKHRNLTGDSAVLMNDWAATVWPFGSESEQQLTCWAAISLLSAEWRLTWSLALSPGGSELSSSVHCFFYRSDITYEHGVNRSVIWKQIYKVTQ